MRGKYLGKISQHCSLIMFTDDDKVRKSAKYLDEQDLVDLANEQEANNPEYFENPDYIPQPTPLSSYLTQYNYITNVKPFNYQKSYTVTRNNFKSRLTKEQYLQVCKYLGMVRPSTLALSISFSEQDLIFIEHTFQRMSLEFEKMMALSGTPSAIWRKTGEIAAIGREFSYLTK